MNQKEIEQKITAYCTGRLSPEEEHDLERYAADHPLLMDALEGYLNDPSQIDRINHLKSLVVAPKQAKVLTLKKLLPYVAATALLLVITTSIYKQGQSSSYADMETSSPAIAESQPDETYTRVTTAGRPETTMRNDATGAAMADEDTNLPLTKDVKVTPTIPPRKKAVNPQSEVARESSTKVDSDQSDLVEPSSSPAGSKSYGQETTDQPSAAMSSNDAGSVTVGKAHKSTSSTRPARRKLLDQYFASDLLTISGSLPLTALSVTSPWPKIWEAVSHLAEENKQKSGTATLRLKLDGGQVTAIPMKNMAAVTDSGIADYLTNGIGLSSKSSQTTDWLIKLEFK